jgi:hypothetical protein
MTGDHAEIPHTSAPALGADSDTWLPPWLAREVKRPQDVQGDVDAPCDELLI